MKDCLIIHLKRSLERKPQVRKLKKDLPYRTKIVEAVDGNKPNNDFSKSYIPRLLRPRYPFSLRSSEVACFKSHQKCWQEILARGLEAALIIEDDVDIIDGEFKAAIKLAMKEIKMGDLNDVDQNLHCKSMCHKQTQYHLDDKLTNVSKNL